MGHTEITKIKYFLNKGKFFKKLVEKSVSLFTHHTFMTRNYKTNIHFSFRENAAMNESTRPFFYYQLIKTRLLVEGLREDDISTLAQHNLCRRVHHNVPCNYSFNSFR
jgi:hypothetical protein